MSKIKIIELPEMKSGGWISKAVNKNHVGYCTPISKSTCTGRRKAFAETMKKHHGFHKAEMGEDLNSNDFQVEDNQFQQLSPSIGQFTGPSHEQGGVDMTYGGKGIEVEGGETLTTNNDGSATVLGNMQLPGTNMKFKTAGKKLAKLENKASKQNDKGAELAQDSDATNRFERLAFNAGALKIRGADMKLKDIDKQKEFLTSLQKAMLDTADEHGIDPQAMSEGKIKKAKYGANMKKAPDGTTLSVSDRNNNPGNIKFNPNTKYGKLLIEKYGAVQGDYSQKDNDYFAKFPTRDAGLLAMKNLLTQGDRYKNATVREAINTWTGGSPYDLSGLGGIKDAKISNLSGNQLDQVLNYMVQGEGTKYGGTNNSNLTPIANIDRTPLPTPDYSVPNLPVSLIPPANFTGNNNISNTTTGGSQQFTGKWNFTDDNQPLPSNIEKLKFEQYAPELYALATNKQQAAQAQKYIPEHYEPYQVSFQDRINNNNEIFDALQSTLSGNPEALSSIAANLYNANSQVSADEFRTNQEIGNDVINKNIGMDNQAQNENLQILDNQYNKQQLAKSKTKEQNQEILNSITSKILQNQYENKTLAATENMSNYRMVDTDGDGIPDKAVYFGADYTPQSLNVPGAQYVTDASGNKLQIIPTSKTKYNNLGVKTSTEVDDKIVKSRVGSNLQAFYNQKYGRGR